MMITGCGNNYQTIKKLGSGSFGTVYQVRDITTNIDYALKIVKLFHDQTKISKQLIAQYDANAMIQNEISIHSTCNHRNIVRLYTYWEDLNSIYLLLEYCSKGHLILPKIQFNDDDVFEVFHQILNGVDYLHQLNIIHRDLKFENILIHEDGTLKLCDFGWAIKVQQLPIQNVMCGTTEYMPPEVVSKYVLDFKLDCWSLGVILYALVHGKFPFDASNQQELIKNILFNQLTIPKRIGIDDGLINLIQALLIKNASLRPTLQQIYLCKWMKQNMKKNNLFNHYENEALKQKVKQKNIQLKIVQNQDKQFFTPKKMVNSCMVKDDFDNHHISIRAPLTCAKLNNSSRTISISTNPSPQTNQPSQIERFFNFLEQKTKFL